MNKKVRLPLRDWKKAKAEGRHFAMLTAYDTCFARLAEAAGVDCILVGDSLANVMLGHKSTREVGMDEMILATAAVARSCKMTELLADMPWQSDVDAESALLNAVALVGAGAHGVKVEGAKIEAVRAIDQAGIAVVGHLGLTPQSADSYRQQGRTKEEQRKILQDATDLQAAGIVALVMEHVPSELGAEVSKSLDVPVIGIGAGRATDGQVLVMHDVLGLFDAASPPFAKRFAELHLPVREAFESFATWARSEQIS